MTGPPWSFPDELTRWTGRESAGAGGVGLVHPGVNSLQHRAAGKLVLSWEPRSSGLGRTASHWCLRFWSTACPSANTVLGSMFAVGSFNSHIPWLHRWRHRSLLSSASRRWSLPTEQFPAPDVGVSWIWGATRWDRGMARACPGCW